MTSGAVSVVSTAIEAIGRLLGSSEASLGLLRGVSWAPQKRLLGSSEASPGLLRGAPLTMRLEPASSNGNPERPYQKLQNIVSSMYIERALVLFAFV